MSSSGQEEGRGELFVISAPSAAGKSTLIRRLFAAADDCGLRLAYSVSTTTRQPRDGEIDGKHYDFVSRQVFREMIRAGEFLEWAPVHDELYGTKRTAVEGLLDKMVDVVLDIDVQGAEQIRSQDTPAVLIFIVPPSFEELEQRLRKRGDENSQQIRTRLRNACAEVEKFESYDYVIVNDDLERAAAELTAIFRARRQLTPRMSPSVEEILSSFTRVRR